MALNPVTVTATQMGIINQLWNAHMARLINGQTNEVTVGSAVLAQIGQGGLDIFCGRFSNLIHAPVVMRIDAHHNVHIHGQRPAGGIRLVSDRRTALNKPSTGNRGMNSRAKLPRPPNSFILYRQHHHPLLKETQPNLHNNEISSILGKQWKNESEEVKDKFKKLAEEMKRQHFRDHPDYQYRPRKASEKKRRMTRRKALASASTTPVGQLNRPTAQATQVALASGANNATSGQTLPALQNNQHSYVDMPAFPTITEIDMTPQGNGILTVGSDDFNSLDLEQMLESFNERLPAGTNTQPFFNPVLYDEVGSDAQDDSNFYSSVCSFSTADDKLEESSMALEMFQQMGGSYETWQTVPAAVRTAQFDANHAASADNEWMRSFTNLH